MWKTIINFFNRKDKQKKKFICPAAFSQVYIYPGGRVFFCPNYYMSPDAELGNINDLPFEDIYNSEKAIKIRNEILNSEYNYCNPKICFSEANYKSKIIPRKNIKYTSKQKKFPQMVSIATDNECNVNCIMCRPQIYKCSEEEIKNQTEKIDAIYIPILKDAKEITLSVMADPFASRTTRLLMKTAAKKYKNLKFNIITNGILADEANLREIGITDKLSKVIVSIHASNEHTYNKIVKNGNFYIAQKNINYLNELKKQNKIKELYLAFVVSSKNYDDIPNFIKYAKENKIPALFWSAVDFNGNKQVENENLNITDPNHPEFKKFLQIISNIELDSEYIHFSQKIRSLKKDNEKIRD